MKRYLFAVLMMLSSLGRPYAVWNRAEKFKEAVANLNCRNCDQAAVTLAKPILDELEVDRYGSANPYFKFVFGKYYRTIGGLDEAKGDTAGAKKEYGKALIYFQDYLGGLSDDDAPSLKTAVLAVGYTYFHLGQFQEGLNLVDKYKGSFDEQDGDLLLCEATLYNGWGYDQLRAGEISGATDNFRKAFKARPQGFPMFANNLVNGLLRQAQRTRKIEVRMSLLDEATTVLKDYKDKPYWKRDRKFNATGRELSRMLGEIQKK